MVIIRLVQSTEMAIVFELWAECTTDAECNALMKHFGLFTATLLTGRPVSFNVARVDSEGAAMRVSSPDIHEAGLQGVLECTESGLRLYRHLKNGPPFRYARVAWEAGCVPMADLKHWVQDIGSGECRLEVECVMDQALFTQLGSPKFCYPFREGYWWTRYQGQAYVPLSSNDQPALKELCLSLFPDYLKY